MPRDRPVLLAANHTGYLDGALVFAVAPRPSHFLVLDKTFDGFLDHLLAFVGMIPIDHDAAATGDLARAGKGVAWLALQSGCEVVRSPASGPAGPASRRLVAAAALRLVVDFGAPVRLDAARRHTGPRAPRSRDRAAWESVATHVAAAAARHGMPLPADVPTDLVEQATMVDAPRIV